MRARRRMPGGVSSPVRAFRAVGGTPPFIASGKGAIITDVDGGRYIDYVGSWGPLIIGHAHTKVVRAIREVTRLGTSFGAPTEVEVEMAELICEALPSVQRIRFVSSGTEATMSALRLARGATGRKKVLKFEGCYHGHADGLLVGAGSGVATLGIPGSPGVPAEFTKLTLQVPYNDLGATAKIFDRWAGELACVIVEPVAGNMGCIPPEPGFLLGLRRLCDRHGALLIFDEVMTGFRVAWGGAQRRFRVRPDITCLGKVIGGGLPAAAYGGSRSLMNEIAPEGPIYQAGTLSGNPLAMAAGLATLRELRREGVYAELQEKSCRLAEGLAERARAASIAFTSTAVGGMFGLFFHSGPIRNFDDTKEANTRLFRLFHRKMLESGIYLAPSAFEAGFMSTAHRRHHIDSTLTAAEQAFRKLRHVR